MIIRSNALVADTKINHTSTYHMTTLESSTGLGFFVIVDTKVNHLKTSC